MKKIKSASACYTGGGIYIFWGEFTDGTYFLFEDIYISFCVIDTPFDVDKEECYHNEWLEEHLISETCECRQACDYILSVLKHIKKHGSTECNNLCPSEIDYDIEEYEKAKSEMK